LSVEGNLMMSRSHLADEQGEKERSADYLHPAYPDVQGKCQRVFHGADIVTAVNEDVATALFVMLGNFPFPALLSFFAVILVTVFFVTGLPLSLSLLLGIDSQYVGLSQEVYLERAVQRDQGGSRGKPAAPGRHKRGGERQMTNEASTMEPPTPGCFCK
jgi:hypothetical protein